MRGQVEQGLQDDARMAPPEDDMTDLDRPVTKRDLAEFATKYDFAGFATKRDLAEFAFDTKREIAELREATRRDVDDLHRHFDIVVESFKSEFRNLFDWVQTTTSTMGGRIDRLETDHGSRFLVLETRVTRLEKRRK
jgi:hypothetical protein